jgi:hypothetical protein
MHADLSVEDLGWVGWAVRSTNRDLNNDLIDFYESNDFDKSLAAFRQEDYKQHLKGLKDPIDKIFGHALNQCDPYLIILELSTS